MKSRTRARIERETREVERISRRFRALTICYAVTILLFSTAMVSAFSNNPFHNSPFAGGWEATGSMESLGIANSLYERPGLHTFTVDTDGDFKAGYITPLVRINPALFDKPGITLETSYPYYIQRVQGQWVLSDTAYVLDKYNVTLRNDENETRIQEYYHWTIGLDVTIKTDASDYYKTLVNPTYLDYGYWFEDDVVNVVALVNFAVTPWTPAGSSGNWTVVGGWNGVMSASVIGVDYGLISEGATENFGHTIQNLHSIGAALNMYKDDSETTVSDVGFDNQEALQGIPKAVEIELSARLGAGADYKNDLIGHCNDIAVRNVFVKYTVRVDVLSTLIWSLRLGHQGGMENPDENNTSYNPQLTTWDAMFETWRQLFYSPQFTLLLITICIAGVLILIVYLKRR